MQEIRVREKMRSQDFYSGSLKPELHPVCQSNLNLTLHYFQKIYKVSTLTLSKYAKTTQKTLESHKNHTKHSKNPLVDQENHQAHTQSLRKIKPQW